MLYATTIKSCNCDKHNFVLSRSTLYRSRKTCCFKIAESVLNKVAKKYPENVALHLDGKLTKIRLGNRLGDLAVSIKKTS